MKWIVILTLFAAIIVAVFLFIPVREPEPAHVSPEAAEKAGEATEQQPVEAVGEVPEKPRVPRTIYVDARATEEGDGTQDKPYETIQHAIDTAKDGDTILVAFGFYSGGGNTNIDFGGKAITLKSQNLRGRCSAINCGNSGRAFIFQKREGRDTIVEGFSILNGKVEDEGGGIYCKGSSPTIINCSIMQCSASRGAGIYCSNANPTLVKCSIAGNEAKEEGGGIYCCKGSAPVFTNCSIGNNEAGKYGGGIYCSKSSPTFNNSFIHQHSVAEGEEIYTADSDSTVTLNYCAFPNGKKEVAGSGRVVEKNCIHDKEAFKVHSGRVSERSLCIDAGDNSLVPAGVIIDGAGGVRIIDGDLDGTSTVDIGAYEMEIATLDCLGFVDIAVGNPALVLFGLSPFLPEKGEISIEILSEPVAGAGNFQWPCPDIPYDHGTPEISQLRVEFPIVVPSLKDKDLVLLTFHNKAAGKYELQLQYKVKGQIWKSKKVVVTAHEVESVKIVPFELQRKESYLVEHDSKLQLLLMAQAAGGIDLGPLDPSEMKWEVLPYDETSDKKGVGSISGEGTYRIYSSSYKRTDTPRLVTLNRIRGTYKRNEVSAEVVVGAVHANRTEFAPTGEPLKIGYTFDREYPGCELHAEDWQWKKDDDPKENAQVELREDGPSCWVRGVAEGHGRLYCKVWLTCDGKESNRVDDFTPMFVVDDDSIFCTRESGADTIFTISGTFRIVAGRRNEFFLRNQWFKDVRVEREDGTVIDDGYPLVVWCTVGSKRIYSSMFSLGREDVARGTTVRVTNTDDK